MGRIVTDREAIIARRAAARRGDPVAHRTLRAPRDCFVAALLAKTPKADIAPEPRERDAAIPWRTEFADVVPHETLRASRDCFVAPLLAKTPKAVIARSRGSATRRSRGARNSPIACRTKRCERLAIASSRRSSQ
jgi:hypothetical protein